MIVEADGFAQVYPEHKVGGVGWAAPCWGGGWSMGGRSAWLQAWGCLGTCTF